MENSERLNRLEEKMDKLESILNGLKDELAKRTGNQPTKMTGGIGGDKWSRLTDVEKRKIDNILNNFDFCKVHEVMVYLGWKWAGSKSDSSIPTTEAARLLVDAAYEKTTIATGGLKATWCDEGDDDLPYISLEFILTDCEGYLDTDDEDEDIV